MWPTPLWVTQIWDFMRSETRVTFNEDFTNWILSVKEKEKSVRKSNRGGWQSELYKPDNEMFREIYDLYSFEVIPKIGEWVAGSEESYRYLAESIRMHPNQEELIEIMEQVGFKECSYSNLTNGVVAVHSGKKRVL